MKKKISSTFLKKLIDSDFLILNNFSIAESRYLKESVTAGPKKKTFVLLDPFETLKSIKQLIRILQLFKKQINPLIHIESDNPQFLEILEGFINNKNNNLLPIRLKKNVFDKMFQRKASNFALLLSQKFSPKVTNRMLEDLSFNGAFVTTKINSKLEKNGTYKIFNDLNTFKKLIFLLILINRIYTK